MGTRQFFFKFTGWGVLLLFWSMNLPAQESRLALKFTGGINYLCCGDTNDYFSHYYEYSTFPGKLGALHLGLDVTGEIIYFLNKKLAISIGSGFIQAKRKDNSYSYASDSYEYSERFDTEIKAVPVKLGVYYILSSTRKATIFLHGGIGYYFCSWSNKYSYRSDNPGIDYNYWYKRSEKATSKGFGLNGGAGMELRISRHFAFLIEGYTRYAPISNFKGEQIQSSTEYDYSETPSMGYLYFYKYYNSYYEAWRTSLGITGRPVGAGAMDVKKATVDFSAFSLKAGIIIRL